MQNRHGWHGCHGGHTGVTPQITGSYSGSHIFSQLNVITILLISLEYLQKLLRMISGKSGRREFFLKKLNLNWFFPIFGQTERLANLAKIKQEVLDKASAPKIWLVGW